LFCNNDFIEITSLGSNKARTIYASENISLEPFKRDTFLVNCPINEDIVFINRVGHVNVLETVADKNSNGNISITIENPTNKQVSIRKGAPMCRVSSCKLICSIKNEQELFNFINDEEIEVVNNINMVKSKPWKPSEKLKFTNDKLTTDQIIKIKNLCNDYWMCFSRNESDIGTVNEEYGTHDIILNNEKPIKQRAYTIPYAKEQVVNDCVTKMLNMGIIEPSNGEWSSPIVLVKKADGSERFCVDYRKVNAVTVKDCFPMPSIESKLNKLSGCKYFTLLDCTSGYWMIKLSERAKKICAFICTKGLFTFKVMPFGLCNAGATFQRIMEFMIKDLVNSTAYIDDVLTFSKTFDEHLVHLKQLFEKFKLAGIKIKTEKCKLACSETKFLGYKVTEKGVTIDDSRIESFKKYTRPRNAK